MRQIVDGPTAIFAFTVLLIMQKQFINFMNSNIPSIIDSRYSMCGRNISLCKAEKKSRGKCEKEAHPNLPQNSKTSFLKMNIFCLRLGKEMTVKIFAKVVKKINLQNKLETCQRFVLECVKSVNIFRFYVFCF